MHYACIMYASGVSMDLVIYKAPFMHLTEVLQCGYLKDVNWHNVQILSQADLKWKHTA